MNNNFDPKHEYRYDESKIFTKKIIKLINDYLDENDWRVKENSNTGFSLSGLNNYIANSSTALYWLYEVYDEEIREAHKNADIHIHDLGLLSSYCTGWDPKDILMYGFGGVLGKIQSKPPKHLRTVLGQIWNFMYTIANEVAGAVAMNNFDTYLAPFIRYDSLSYEEVKQCIQEFVYNMNIPTRSGFQCVSQDTEIYTPDGWKTYSQIKEGDEIYTYNMETKQIEVKPVLNIFVKEYKGNMYHIKNNFTDQLLSPDHRLVIYDDIESKETYFRKIKAFYDSVETYFNFPYIKNIRGKDVSKIKIEVKEVLKKHVSIVSYDGIIWCPTTENQTIIAKRNGFIFISGNSPFSNITLDFTVPEHLKNQPVIIGGKIQNISYGDFQKEMDMFNDAFYEVMMEGDKNGQIFSYPIPTVNITKNFDWNNPRYDKMWEASAKYGMNYFANYIHTDMKPEDALSMCPLEKSELILYKENEEDTEYKLDTIEKIYEKYGEDDTIWAYSNGKFVECFINKFKNKRLYKILLENGIEISTSKEHLNIVKPGYKKDIEEEYPTYKLDSFCYLPFSLKISEDVVKLSNDEKELYGIFQLMGILYLNGYYDDEENKFVAEFESSTEDEILIESLKNEFRTDYSIKSLNNFSIEYENGFFEISIKDDRFKNTYILNYFDINEDGELVLKDLSILKNNYYLLASFLEGLMLTSFPKRKIKIYNNKQKEFIMQLFIVMAKVPYIEIAKSNDDFLYQISVMDELEKSSFIFHKDNKFQWVKVKKVTETFTFDDVYCLEVYDEEENPFFTVATSGIVTHNCRLRLDLRELQRSNTGLFSAGTKTGSIGVVTINMPRLGYLSKTKKEFKERLIKLMDIAIRSLLKKREVIEKFTEQGMYPYVRYYLQEVYDRHGSYWANHFNTIGIIGMNEACENFLGKDISTPEGLEFTKEIMEFMRERITEYQIKYKQHVNFEGVPGESLSYRFAKHDKKKYPDIKTAGTKDSPYYTNSCHLPVAYTDNIFEMLSHQSKLQPLFTGGIVSHIFLGERLDSPEQAKLIIKKSVENFSLPYISLTPTFSICPEHGYLPGEHEFCPICIDEGKTEEEARLSNLDR